jgi:hypothetical protein
VAQGREMPLEVDAEDGVPLVFTGVGQHAIPDEAGVVDQNVQPAEGVDGGLDQVALLASRPHHHH